jgi:sodium transport system permease protein
MMAIAVFARSFKEAQNYLSPLYTVAMLPAAVVFIPGVKLTYGLALAPVAGPALFIKQFAVGTLDWGLGSVVLLATCFYAALALWGAAALFAREDVVLAETDLLSWRYLRASLRQGRRDRPAAGEVLVLFAVVLLLIYYVGSWLQHRSLGMGLILTQLLLVLNPALLFLAVLRYDLRATLRLRWPGGRRLLAAVCAAVGGALLTAEIAVLQNLILPLPEGFKSQAEELMKQVEGYGLPAALLVGAVLVGCCEETLFRGVILAGMLRSWRPAAAITLTAMLFGICHLSPYRLLTTTLLGLLLGYLAWRSGSLWCSIAAHASVNGLALGLAFSPLAQQPWVQEMAHLPPALLAAGLLLCVGGVAALHSLSPPPDAEIRAVNG